jgi:ATP-dependent Zn protease
LLEKIKLTITLKQTSSSDEQLLYEGNLGAELMNEYISLGKYQKDYDGEFIFKIEVPAELKNDYTLSATKVKWVFAVEKIQNNTQEKNIKNTVKTGDNIFYMITLLVLLILIIIIIFVIKKKQANDSKEHKRKIRQVKKS